jgi:hypothetical protein
VRVQIFASKLPYVTCIQVAAAAAACSVTLFEAWRGL